jgi:plasmid stabilization system protein ParE
MDYIDADRPNAATSIAERVIHATHLLSRHPGIGRPARRRDLREWPVRGTPFVLLYRTGAERVEILRLLHHAQRG